MRAPPPIPDKTDLLCGYCRLHRKRELIVDARWSGPSGRQPLYTCMACRARIKRNTKAAR